MKGFGILFALLATALGLSSCVSLPSSAKAKIHFETKATTLPANIEWNHVEKAHELINIRELVVIVSGGEAPMPDAEWAKYKPPLPWQKNIERNLLFTYTYFLRSPNAPEGATGSARYTIRNVSGHTWVELAKPVSVDFIPSGQTTDILKPSPGHLAVKTIIKPQAMRWEARIWQLTDNKGNYYVMHATETGTPSLDVDLPTGWSLKKVDLAEPLVIMPSEGGYYNVLGDCLGQGYHQYIFADPVYPAEQSTNKEKLH